MSGGIETVEDLLQDLGGISAARVRVRPPPGQATEGDLIRLNERGNRLYELVEGTLVEKVMGFPESALAVWLIRLLGRFLDRQDLGFLAGADGAIRLMPGLVRIPDVSFVSWERVPVRGRIPRDAISGLAPDLAVEVLSEGNTEEEMERKLKEYFLSGVRLVWLVDPVKRVVKAHVAPDQSVTLTEGQALDGGIVLPGLSLPMAEIFAQAAPEPEPPAKGKRRRKGGRGQAEGQP
jgi:Uma2 family endonuclease